MDFTLTDIHRDIRVATRTYLTDRYPPERIARAADETGHDLGAWDELVRQGWFDESVDPVGLAVVAEESGRALHPVPWWTTLTAAPAWPAAAPLTEPVTVSGAVCEARCQDGTWRLDGDAGTVADAATCTALLVAARTGDGTALFAVCTDGPGVRAMPVAGPDPLRPESRLTLANAPALLLVAGDRASAVHTAMLRRAAVLLACEAVGVADRALDVAIGHAGVRHQFGRAIGSYQAVAHRLADCYAEMELARSSAYRAAAVLAPEAGASDEEISDAIAVARHISAGVAVQVCEAAVQVHGAMGLTWEFPLHRWYRRALWIESWMLRGADPLDEVATALLGPA